VVIEVCRGRVVGAGSLCGGPCLPGGGWRVAVGAVAGRRWRAASGGLWAVRVWVAGGGRSIDGCAVRAGVVSGG
jgi:hypothetical protein